MWTRVRIPVSAALALLVAVALTACGGNESSDGSGSGSGSGKDGGTITMVSGSAADSLDPHVGYTSQSFTADWAAYTGLVTYSHASAGAGSELIPGLATALPKISRDGKTYEFTLREGLTFSDGTPVKASDFAYSIQRMLRVNWGGKSFFTGYIAGAQAFDEGKAKSISGIVTDDATGRITIELTQPYGAFANVLAFPAAALVPSGTPMKNLPNDPPPGVGPYRFASVVPNRGYTLEKNPEFASFEIPGLPTGHADRIELTLESNTQTEAQKVLDNQVDVFDYADTIPPAMIQQIENRASDRFRTETLPSTFYFFLNTTKAPFNDIRARQAVNYAIDRDALVRLTSGFMKPNCYLLPEGVEGNPTGPCPYGDEPDLEKAQALIREAGLEGTPVTVWGQERSPRREYVDYYTDLLNKIGFKATQKIVADETYVPTIGDAKTDPQTGTHNWLQDFPNPSDFYLLLDKASIQPTNNLNFSKVDDPKIQAALKKLNSVPATELETVAEEWRELDEYVAEQAYIVAYGSTLSPLFFSERIDAENVVFHNLYGTDLTSLRLK